MAARILAAVAAFAMSASTQTISPAEFEVATIKLNPVAHMLLGWQSDTGTAGS